jgi:hypothetical protein
MLTAVRRRQSAGEMSVIMAGTKMPAFATTMPTLPKSSAASITCGQPASSVTS